MARALLACLALCATFLAGCSGGDPQPTETPPIDCSKPANASDPLCQGDAASIKGVVTDAAIKPLAGARVVVTVPGQGSLQTNTSAAGSFAFSGLGPGTYFVQASKLGYNPTQVPVEVVRDVPARITKIVLQADPTSIPYYTAYSFQGYFECSVSTPVVGYNACSQPNEECVPDDSNCVYNTGNVTQDNFGTFYTLDKKPTYVQSEMVWESTQQLGSSLTLLHSYPDDSCEPFYCDYEATGTSPVVLRNKQNEINAAGWGENETQLFVRAFASQSEQLGGAVGGTFEQSFTIYTHVFYGYAPPETWTFGEMGDPPRPQ